MTSISANALDLTFLTNDGSVHALKDVTLDIQKGGIVSFIGPSDCGKTTFQRLNPASTNAMMQPPGALSNPRRSAGIIDPPASHSPSPPTGHPQLGSVYRRCPTRAPRSARRTK